MKIFLLSLLIACCAAGAEFLNNVIVSDRTMMATSWTNSIIATNLPSLLLTNRVNGSNVIGAVSQATHATNSDSAITATTATSATFVTVATLTNAVTNLPAIDATKIFGVLTNNTTGNAATAQFVSTAILTNAVTNLSAPFIITATANRDAVFDSLGRLTNDLASAGNGAPVHSNAPSLYAPIVNSATASRAAIYDASGRLTNGTIAAADFPALIGDVTTVAGALTTTLVNSHQIASGTTGGVNMPASTTWFAPLWCTVSNAVTVDVSGSTRSLMPRSGTIRNLYFIASGAVGSAQTNTITILTNGVATGLTCFIQGTSATSANDTTHTATFLAGTEIGIRMITTSGTTARKFAWALQID